LGKEDLGSLAAILDTILKLIIDGKGHEGFYVILTESLPNMKLSMAEPNYDLNLMISNSQQFLSNFK